MNRLILFLSILGLIGSLQAQAAPKKLLVVTTTAGFRHSSIPTAQKVIAALGASSQAYSIDLVEQPPNQPIPPKRPAALKPDATPEEQAQFKADEEKFKAALAAHQPLHQQWMESLRVVLQKLSPESLNAYDGVIFANTTGDLPIPDKEGFLDWLRSGKAFVGMHSATDTFHKWPEYLEMIGGQFNGHGPQVCVECINENATHPATSHLGKTWRIPQEEIYQFKNYDPARVQELLVLDKHPNNGTPGRFPISWCREYGKGRVFYTALGHREDIWDADPAIPNRKNPVEVSQAFQGHILGGIKWALGL